MTNTKEEEVEVIKFYPESYPSKLKFYLFKKNLFYIKYQMILI